MMTMHSVADMERAIAAGLHRIDRDQVDVVVGVPRSGMIAASIIATWLHKPLADVEGLCRGAVSGISGRLVAEKPSRILLVEDSCRKGRSFAWAVERLRDWHPEVMLTRLAVFGPADPEVDDPCDVFLAPYTRPVLFSWNIWKSVRLKNVATDLDGVLCRDVEKGEDDQGDRYRRFLETAEPRFLPYRRLAAIVTGRRERWRGETEAWLARHGVTFDVLEMLPDDAGRMTAWDRGIWKAVVVERLMARLDIRVFVESSRKEATPMAGRLSIPVWCVETMSVV